MITLTIDHTIYASAMAALLMRYHDTHDPRWKLAHDKLHDAAMAAVLNDIGRTSVLLKRQAE